MKRILSIAVAAALGAGLALTQAPRSAEVQLKAAEHKQQVEGDLKSAIEQYRKLAQNRDQAVAAKALLRMGECYEKLGDVEARKAYEQVLSRFPNQTGAVAEARARLAALKSAGPPTITVRQVWAGPDMDISGAPSRDGAFLTLSESRDLAIRDLRTGQKRRLTKHTGTFESPRWSVPSPDGKQVAYMWFNTDLFTDLRIVGIDGSEPRVLYRNAELSPWVTDWSPDGKFLLAVLSRKDKNDQMVLVSVRDGSVRILKTSERGGFDRPRFSPDGRYIAYAFPQRPGSGDDGILLLALDSGREIPLQQHPADEDCPDWTPDGRGILFRSDRTGPMGLWWIQVADGKPQGTPVLVKSDLGNYFNFRAMGFTRNGSYYYGIRRPMSDVYVAQIDLATGKLLAPPALAAQKFLGSNNRPDWSPDGRDLLFLSSRGNTAAWAPRTLKVRSLESGEVRELASKLNRVSWVRWSPDGRSLLANGNVSGEFGIYRINIETGDFATVVRDAQGWPASWSRDGKEIFYVKRAAKRFSILARDLETGQERELHSVALPSFYTNGAALSRDGRQLAFAVGDESQTTLKIMPAAGGEARDLLRGVRLPLANPIAWTPDGLSVLFPRKPIPGNSKTELWSVSVQGGEPRRLDLTAENMRDISVHPDGRHIAFAAGRDRSEVWVMENFLPAKP